MPEAGKEGGDGHLKMAATTEGTEFADGLFVIHDEQIHRQGRTARNDFNVEIWLCHGQPEPERERALFQKRNPVEMFINDVMIYRIITRLLRSGIFGGGEWTIASKKTGKVPKWEWMRLILGILVGVSGFESYGLFDILIADHFSCGGKKFFTSNEKPSSVVCECCSTAPTAATRHE
jgi:hypothetical protein